MCAEPENHHVHHGLPATDAREGRTETGSGDRRPSPQVLTALADALRLPSGERAHLHRLTKAADPHYNCLGRSAPAHSVRDTVRAILHRLEPSPAVLLNRLGDILAHTDGFDRLMRPIGLLDAGRPNLPRFVLTDPRARDAYPDWDQVADQQVAMLKDGPFRAEPHMAALADELTVTAGDDFSRRVDSVPGFWPSNGVIRLTHPHAGGLRLAYETLDLPADDDQHLVIHLPADAASATALDRLSPVPALRLVT
jgi:hypothetical protein